MFSKVPQERNHKQMKRTLTGKSERDSSDVTNSNLFHDLFLWAVFMNRYVYIEMTPQNHGVLQLKGYSKTVLNCTSVGMLLACCPTILH